MMGIQLMLLAGLFVSISNYFMRKSVDSGGTTKGFIMVQLFVVFLVAILLNPVRMGDYQWSGCMSLFAIAGGVVLALMMASLGRAVETGPAGLTFASFSAATVMPSVVMVLIFGSFFGYDYTRWNGIGSILVVLGLFWAGWQTKKSQKKNSWITFVSAAFFLHVLFLVFLSWKALFINYPGENGLFLSFDMDDAKNQWFMPMIFLAASIIQALIFIVNEKRWLKKGEVLYGILGGIANGVGTFFMIRATEVSTKFEHAMIYPIFSVTIIVLCNIWGQWLYKEKVNWKAAAVCVLGVLIGTISWGAIFPKLQ
jgi:drug/metabolite transporter (DMT)-like permease